jgi:predicted nucleic acid-binding protein
MRPWPELGEVCRMVMNATKRAKPVGYTDNKVIEAAYALAKSKSEENARQIVNEITRSILPALLKHMKEHSNLFSSAIHAMVADGVNAPAASKAEALFS